jgi:type IV secretory pathway VirB6-like protein
MLINSDNIFTRSLKIGLCYLLISSTLLLPTASYAGIQHGSRYDGSINDDGDITQPITIETSRDRCNVGRLEYDPFDSKDFNWEVDNGVCIALLVSVGVTLQAAQSASSYACLQPQVAAENAVQFAAGVMISPKMIKDRAKEAIKCKALLTAGSWGLAASCCGAMSASLLATAAAFAALSILWDQAGVTFERARICGHDWKKWRLTIPEGGNSSDAIWVKGDGDYANCLKDLFIHDSLSGSCIDHTITPIENNAFRDIKNKPYREWIYGGKEYKDTSEDNCRNPTSWDSERRNRILGYDDDEQRYYMVGAGGAPVYACYRFLSTALGGVADTKAMKDSYDCCRSRSQSSVCFENIEGFNYATGIDTFGNDYEHEFCETGSRCEIGRVWFEAYKSHDNPGYACVKTYSLCPYNHLLGGGTEETDVDIKNPSLVNNFCQVFNHCSKLPVLPYIYTSGMTGEYVAQACRDLKGDSQNSYGFSADLLPINTRGFSAPFVQCFKESIENMFLHKAGHSLCLNPEEEPANDVCASGYNYERGERLPGNSFFEGVQTKVRQLIKIMMVASIISFGFSILLAVPGSHITRKVLIMYVVKLGLVMYFAIGTAWQDGFMQGVLGTSGFLADLSFKVKGDDENQYHQEGDFRTPGYTGEATRRIVAASTIDNSKLDGCQFPRFDYSSFDEDTRYDRRQYPPGKGYLRIWDTLDCKIARALGFGPDVSVPNLIMAIIAGFFTGGLGIVFFVAAFLFAFHLLSMTMTAMHIFIMSMVSIIVLLYVSPIMIALAFFERTKKIFEAWWRQLLGFTLQPMILFAYLGILISLFDVFLIGSATFEPSSQIMVEGTLVDDVRGWESQKTISCDGDAEDDSLYCIFRLVDIGTFRGFDVIGIGIPFLISMNKAKMATVIKAQMVFFVLSCFMDQIMGLASKLVGGTALKSGWNMSVTKTLVGTYAVARGVQSRGVRAAAKHVPRVARGVGGVAKKLMGSDRGKAGKAAAMNRGADHIPKDKPPGGGGNDHADAARGKGADAAVDNAKPKADQVKKPAAGADTTGSKA